MMDSGVVVREGSRIVTIGPIRRAPRRLHLHPHPASEASTDGEHPASSEEVCANHSGGPDDEVAPHAVHDAADDGDGGGNWGRVGRVARGFKTGPHLERPPA